MGPLSKIMVSSKTKKNLVLVFAIFFVLFGSTFLEYQYINHIKSDYDLRLAELSQNLQKDIQDKQDQIDELSSQIEKTNEQVVKTNQEYALQFGELKQQIGDLNVESESFSNVISNTINSVVSVLTDIGQGSGAIISSDGYVVTNYHVISGASKATILTYDGKKYPLKVMGYNKGEDIAVLKIVSNETFDYFEFGDSSNLKAGQKVVALGNPAGLSFTATEGIISSPSRAINGKTYIQTDVTVNPGNSGGPLINSQGEIIGIVDFKIANYESLSFAIPSDRVKNIVDEII